jgi:uncharacterized integral membrane protein (TIGR00698 family)
MAPPPATQDSPVNRPARSPKPDRGKVNLARQCWGPEPLNVLAPGLALVATVAAVAFVVHQRIPVVSAHIVAVLLGAALSNTGKIPGHFQAGITWAGKKLLRLGVVLLGFRLTIGDIGRLGPRGLGLVVVVVTCTFFGTQWLGKRLGLSAAMSLLVATGFSICGASAVAAMRGVVPEAGDEDVAYAVALVTICGTLAIVVLPAVGPHLGFRGASLGSWIGASVHDVAQTVATASSASANVGKGPVADAIKGSATLVKLTRVVLLAPLVTGVSLARRRRGVDAADREWVGARPPIIPLFVACFLGAIAVRSLGFIPKRVLLDIKNIETLLFAAAMVSLGAGVRFAKLAKVGPRPLILGLSSWVLIAAVSALGVRLLGI